jgi:hypothetical protein
VRDARRLLGIYLRDHLAGSAAGVALVRRCRNSNRGTELGVILQEFETQIVEDRQSLHNIMRRLNVRESVVKEMIGSVVEMVGRLKSNGRLTGYSPSSRVVELETLAAGVFTKRSLWLSLRAVVDDYVELDREELEQLITRATAQYQRLIAEHDRAAAIAFATSRSGSSH